VISSFVLGCAVAVDDLQAFKEHHRFCDNARNTSSLICVHCRRSFVRLDKFFEHIGSHGMPRYFCSLCDFKHTTGPKVSEHMKVHKVSKAKAIPADSKRNDRGVDIYFIVPDSVSFIRSSSRLDLCLSITGDGPSLLMGS